MRTCGLSHQIMGPITVKMAKTGFMRKIANLQLEVPYFDMIVHTQVHMLKILDINYNHFYHTGKFQVLSSGACYYFIFGPRNRTQGRCV